MSFFNREGKTRQALQSISETVGPNRVAGLIELLVGAGVFMGGEKLAAAEFVGSTGVEIIGAVIAAYGAAAVITGDLFDSVNDYDRSQL